MTAICEALIAIAKALPNLAIAYPVHPNPEVQATTARLLSGHERIHLIAPLDYDVFCALMATSRLILTDSGGIQEEAPSLHKPVLVLRDTSERPEAVAAGAARLVGTDPAIISAAALELLTDDEAYRRMTTASNPYGDGYTARRIVEHTLERSSSRS